MLLVEYGFINQVHKANASSSTMKKGISVSSDGQGSWWRKPIGAVHDGISQLRTVEDLTVRRGPVGTDIYPGEPVIGIGQV